MKRQMADLDAPERCAECGDTRDLTRQGRRSVCPDCRQVMDDDCRRLDVCAAMEMLARSFTGARA